MPQFGPLLHMYIELINTGINLQAITKALSNRCLEINILTNQKLYFLILIKSSYKITIHLISKLLFEEWKFLTVAKIFDTFFSDEICQTGHFYRLHIRFSSKTLMTASFFFFVWLGWSCSSASHSVSVVFVSRLSFHLLFLLVFLLFIIYVDVI